MGTTEMKLPGFACGDSVVYIEGSTSDVKHRHTNVTKTCTGPRRTERCYKDRELNDGQAHTNTTKRESRLDSDKRLAQYGCASHTRFEGTAQNGVRTITHASRARKLEAGPTVPPPSMPGIGRVDARGAERHDRWDGGNENAKISTYLPLIFSEGQGTPLPHSARGSQTAQTMVV
ncbi:hypothetical protein B0H17DRAFT_1128540 [Mycena rosella]|uniref:Uncharacterized protein n=1 Tax=Mycena rosella TaxID=1033263 RepID=A0AAD7DVD2_MYCRO|nr:hypothetical protein B0H17DRAFT_1128540 [Mycena rosella]